MNEAFRGLFASTAKASDDDLASALYIVVKYLNFGFPTDNERMLWTTKRSAINSTLAETGHWPSNLMPDYVQFVRVFAALGHPVLPSTRRPAVATTEVGFPFGNLSPYAQTPALKSHWDTRGQLINALAVCLTFLFWPTNPLHESATEIYTQNQARIDNEIAHQAHFRNQKAHQWHQTAHIRDQTPHIPDQMVCRLPSIGLLEQARNLIAIASNGSYATPA